jgi:hypothetical protein
MAIELDHVIVSSRSKVASARQLAELLGVGWSATAIGPFAAVFVNDGLTLDFFETDESFPVEHFCFRVAPADFDAILARIQAAGIAYRSKCTTRSTCRSTTSSAASTSTGTNRTATSGRC